MTVTVQLPVPFSSFLMEYQYLVAFYVRKYFGYHFSAFHYRRSHRYVAFFVYQIHLIELYLSAALCVDAVNE